MKRFGGSAILGMIMAVGLVLPAPATAQGEPDALEDLLRQWDEEDRPDWMEDLWVQPRPVVDRPFALFRGLNKATAQVQPVNLAVGETVQFGTLSLTLRACRSTEGARIADDAAFIEIVERPTNDDPPRGLFSGWMFASSRTVAAMEHPVYDVWLTDCVTEVPQPPEDMERDRDFDSPQEAPLPAPTPEWRL